MKLSFRPLTRSDFPLLQKWLSEPHVEEWWHQPLDHFGVEDKYGPRVDGIEPTYLFVILFNEKPAGWIQWYKWTDYPDHAAQLGAELTAAGIDLAIGEKELLGNGLGTAVIIEFLNRIIFADPGITAIVTDPEEKNFRSLRAFEKAGFVATKTVQLKGETVLRRVVTISNNKGPADLARPYFVI